MADAKIPSRLGKYELIEPGPLRTGGEAEIWKAINPTGSGEREVVLRVLKKFGPLCTKDIQRHFNQEVERLQQLNHPSIIRLLGSGWGKEYPYLVMPFMPEGSLGDALKKDKKFSLEERIGYIRQAADALSFAHQRSIIHRDVKPDNLLLDGKGRIFLSDFGVAIDAEATPPHTRDWGTHPYCPPEQRKGKPVPASDQYALAVIMYELFTGKRPDKENPDEAQNDLQEKFPEIAKVFMRAWNDDHTQRYPSMEEFKREFSQAALSDLLRQSIAPNPPEEMETVAQSLSSSGGLNLVVPVAKRPCSWSRFVKVAVSVLFLLVLALFSGGGWIARGLVDRQPLFSLQAAVSPTVPITPCLHTITNLNDNGAGTLRQSLSSIPAGQSCIIAFASPLHGTLALASPLAINRNVTIEAPGPGGQLDQNQVAPSSGDTQSNQNPITITLQTPQAVPSITITIGAGYTVLFQNISFLGRGDNEAPQPSAFIQVNSANVKFIHCDLSNFNSDSDGSALSNRYGNVELDDTTIRHNISADFGGAIYNLGLVSLGKGTLTLSGSMLADNQANYRGGGIYNLGGILRVEGSKVNQNSTQFNDAEIEGGGAIASWDGVLDVAGTTISNSQANGYGGGVLLVGTDAQIVGSHIQGNDTAVASHGPEQVTGEGGGIAVEPDKDNNRLSHLILSNTSFDNNRNNYSSVDSPTDNYSGTLAAQSTHALVVVSEPVSPSSIDHLLGSLTIDDFGQFCQAYPNSNFIGAAPASVEDGTIVCVAPDGKQEPLAKLQQKQDIQSAVQAVCQSHSWDPGKDAPKNVLARLFNYWDPLSWQCFTSEKQFASQVTEGELTAYCSDTFAKSFFSSLTHNTSSTAYDWICGDGSVHYRIQMDVVCQRLTNNQHAIAVLDPKDFTHPLNWQCWEPD